MVWQILSGRELGLGHAEGLRQLLHPCLDSLAVRDILGPFGNFQPDRIGRDPKPRRIQIGHGEKATIEGKTKK